MQAPSKSLSTGAAAIRRNWGEVILRHLLVPLILLVVIVFFFRRAISSSPPTKA
jgi:hypothetical protein